jgi:hypothetical protein
MSKINELFPESCPNCGRDLHATDALQLVFDQRRSYSGDLDESGMIVGYSFLRLPGEHRPMKPEIVEEELRYVLCSGCGFNLADDSGDDDVLDVSTLESEHERE